LAREDTTIGLRSRIVTRIGRVAMRRGRSTSRLTRAQRCATVPATLVCQDLSTGRVSARRGEVKGK
jgi:hypothetical protein